MSKQGKIKDIDVIVKTKADNGFYAEDAVLVRFTNRGDTRWWIDEDEVLEPGESFVEGDLSGPGIDHRYQLKPIPAANAVTVDEPVTYSGPRLHIRVFKRESDARK